MCWSKRLAQLTARAALHPVAPAQLATKRLWNMYCVSLVLCPAQVAEPSRSGISRLAAAFRLVNIQTAWAPWWVAHGIGVVLGVAGAPRSPIALAAAGAFFGGGCRPAAAAPVTPALTPEELERLSSPPATT